MAKKPNTSKRRMIGQVMSLFEKGQYPSASAFRKLLTGMPPEEQSYYYCLIYRSTLVEWKTLYKKEQAFLRYVIQHDPQKYLDFLFRETILGALRYKLEDPESAAYFIELLEKGVEEKRYSRTQMLFAFLRSFESTNSLFSMHEQFRKRNNRGEGS